MKTITLNQQVEREVKNNCDSLLGLDYSEELQETLKDKEACLEIHKKQVKFYASLVQAGKITNYIVNPDKSITII